MMRKVVLLVCLAALLSAGLAAGAAAMTARSFPSIIPLPDGFRPEGIVDGRGHELFAGSLANGAIYRANARTGEGEVLVPGETGRVTVGLAFDPAPATCSLLGARRAWPMSSTPGPARRSRRTR